MSLAGIYVVVNSYPLLPSLSFLPFCLVMEQLCDPFDSPKYVRLRVHTVACAGAREKYFRDSSNLCVVAKSEVFILEDWSSMLFECKLDFKTRERSIVAVS